VVVLDVSEPLVISDYFVICSGNSDRQVRAIAEEVERACREEGTRPLRREGEREARWVLLDFVGVEYISSVGLRVLMLASKQAKTQGGSIGVAALQPAVKEIFDISRFTMVLDVFPSVREGLARLSPPALAALTFGSSMMPTLI